MYIQKKGSSNANTGTGHAGGDTNTTIGTTSAMGAVTEASKTQVTHIGADEMASADKISKASVLDGKSQNGKLGETQKDSKDTTIKLHTAGEPDKGKFNRIILADFIIIYIVDPYY